MFGLSFEKLFLVAIFAGLVIGPQRLPLYTHRLAEMIRSFRSFVDMSKARAETDLGISQADLAAIDVRRYDPRRLVRDALTESPPSPDPDKETQPDLEEQATRVRPGQKYLVTGGSAHPRRILIASLPETDPRRVAAYVPPPSTDDEAELLLTEVNNLLREPPPAHSAQLSP